MVTDLNKWRNRNLSYYRDSEDLFQFFVQPNTDILEVGSGLGYLLNAVRPRYGLGIDINSQSVELARQKFPDLHFEVEDAEFFHSNRYFDYILLANTISYLGNIQATFLKLHKICQSSTKIILTFHNPAWEPILKLATLLKQRMPIKNLNWLSYEDVENLLILEDFEIVCHNKQMVTVQGGVVKQPVALTQWKNSPGAEEREKNYPDEMP